MTDASPKLTALAAPTQATPMMTPTEIITAERRQLVRDMFCKDATDAEFEMFVNACNRLRLDPFARQIYAVKRYDQQLRRMVMAIQIGIDGFRLTAQRSTEYQGQTPTQWCGPDGVWHDAWLHDKPPVAARVGVHRVNFREPLYAVARFASYVQTDKEGRPTRNWSRMPDIMIAKCAEALAIRKAFPAELSNVYAPEEMAQADVPVDDDVPAPAAALPRTTESSTPPAAVRQKRPAQRQAKAPPPKLDDVLRGIEMAETLEQLAQVRAMGAALADQGERADARVRYMAKERTLRQQDEAEAEALMQQMDMESAG